MSILHQQSFINIFQKIWLKFLVYFSLKLGVTPNKLSLFSTGCLLLAGYSLIKLDLVLVIYFANSNKLWFRLFRWCGS